MGIITVESATIEELVACIQRLKTLESVELMEEELYLIEREDPLLVAECTRRHRHLLWSLHNETNKS